MTLVIRIPKPIIDEVKPHITPKSYVPTGFLEALVQAIDHDEPSVCRRLDLHAFTIVYLVMSRSEESLALQRGFFLLAVTYWFLRSDMGPNLNKISLFENAISSAQEKTFQLEIKTYLGHKALESLIRHFTSDQKSGNTRRSVRGLKT